MSARMADAFVCPISRQVFRDPVILSSGHTYERRHIKEWLARGNARCPLTWKKLEHPIFLVPNFALRNAICAWTEERVRRRQMAAGSSKPGQMRQTQHSESEPEATIYEAEQQTAGAPKALQQAEGAHRAQNALPSEQPQPEAAQHAAQHAEAGHFGQGGQMAGAAQPAAQQPSAQCGQQAAQQGVGGPPVQAGPSVQFGQGGHRAEADQAATQQLRAPGAQQAGQHGETGHSGRAGQPAHPGQRGQRAGAAQPAANQPTPRGMQLPGLRRARSVEFIHQTVEQEQRAAARASAVETAEQQRAEQAQAELQRAERGRRRARQRPPVEIPTPVLAAIPLLISLAALVFGRDPPPRGDAEPGYVLPVIFCESINIGRSQ